MSHPKVEGLSMHGRAKIVLYLLGLMILAVAPAACGGKTRQKSASTSTTEAAVIGQTPTPQASPMLTETPKPSTPAASPTAAAQATAVTPAISTPKATPAPSPASTPTAPTAAATTPAPLGPGNVTLNDSWFISPSVGWLAGQGCVQVKPGTSTGQPPAMQCTGVIFRTIDGGRHWSTLLTGSLIPCKLQFTSNETGWLIGVKNGDCGGEVAASGVVEQSSDGGASWTTRYQTSQPGILPVDVRFTSNDQGWVTLRDCRNGADNPCAWQVISTADAGQDWSTTTLPITAQEASLTHPDANDGWVIAGANGHVNIADSHDGGRTWQLRLIPTPFGGLAASIFFLNAEQGWFLTGGEPGAGSQIKGLYGTTDGGQNWSGVAVGDPKALLAGPLGFAGYVGPIAFTTPSDGWIVLVRGGLIHTTDGGKHWSSVKAVPVEPSPSGIQFNGSELGWITAMRYVMLTSDGGRSWQSVSMPPSFPPEPGISPNYQPSG